MLPSPNANKIKKKDLVFRVGDLLFEHKEEKTSFFFIQNNENPGIESPC